MLCTYVYTVYIINCSLLMILTWLCSDCHILGDGKESGKSIMNMCSLCINMCTYLFSYFTCIAMVGCFHYKLTAWTPTLAINQLEMGLGTPTLTFNLSKASLDNNWP